MLVTIIIPAYNAASHLDATIESVRDQSFKKWELIIVDGGSKDDTFGIAEDWGERDDRIVAMRHRGGNAVAACNAGLAHRSRSSKYLLFLDHDDILAHDALKNLVEALETEREVVAAYGRFGYVDGDGNELRGPEADRFTNKRLAVYGNRVVPLDDDEPLTFPALALQNCIASTGQVLVRTEAVQHLGPFDIAAFPCDDWDMWLRLSLLGGLRLVDRVTLQYRVHDGKRIILPDEPDTGDVGVRRKLVKSLAGLEAGRLVINAWRLRDKMMIGVSFRRAFGSMALLRFSQARKEFARASDRLAAYRKQWGWWRPSGRPPVELVTAPQSPSLTVVESSVAGAAPAPSPNGSPSMTKPVTSA